MINVAFLLPLGKTALKFGVGTAAGYLVKKACTRLDKVNKAKKEKEAENKQEFILEYVEKYELGNIFPNATTQFWIMLYSSYERHDYTKGPLKDKTFEAYVKWLKEEETK